MVTNTPTEPCPEFDYKNWQATDEAVRAPNNRRLTKALFKEMIAPAQLKKFRPVYTLREHALWEPYHGFWLPSAKQIYLQSADEYEAAKKLVVSIEHWNYLVQLDWFVEGVDKDASWTSLSQWREEHRIAKESDVVSKMMAMAERGNVQAMKTLLDRFAPKTRGRPSKEEVEGEKKKATQRDSDVDKDADRVMSLVKR